jgi:hypothetical protein
VCGCCVPRITHEIIKTSRRSHYGALMVMVPQGCRQRRRQGYASICPGIPIDFGPNFFLLGPTAQAHGTDERARNRSQPPGSSDEHRRARRLGTNPRRLGDSATGDGQGQAGKGRPQPASPPPPPPPPPPHRTAATADRLRLRLTGEPASASASASASPDGGDPRPPPPPPHLAPPLPWPAAESRHGEPTCAAAPCYSSTLPSILSKKAFRFRYLGIWSCLQNSKLPAGCSKLVF